jgi:hypothetical protein
MTRPYSFGLPLAACLAILQMALAPNSAAKELKVISEKTVTGFGHVESVAYDPGNNVLYTSDLGPDLNLADKDGKGKITKVSLDGKILEPGFLPAAGQILNKPKGIFANDVTVIGGVLYVSDNFSDQLVRVEPADFLTSKTAPRITDVFSGKSINPNGLYPGKDGSLLMVGFKSNDEPRGIYAMASGKEPEAIADKIGTLDGLYQMKDGDLLVTDWATGSLFQWNKKTGLRKLATDFKGPADFCVVANKQGLLVVVPDLVKGELRFVQLAE